MNFHLLISIFLIVHYVVESVPAYPLHGTQIFSGVYHPDIMQTANDFSAAWLVSRERLLVSEVSLKLAQNMAGATFAVVRHRTDKSYTSILTRDFFDFFVEHLSSTSNQIPHSNLAVMSEQTMKLNQTAHLLQHELFFQQKSDDRLDQTLAILIFSSLAFSVPKEIRQHSDIRTAYFTATFYSLYRYFQNICIFVGNEKDRQILTAAHIPAWDIEVLSVQLDSRNYTTALPRDSLLHIIERFKQPQKYRRLSQFKYIYFSEGDQILHMRHVRELYNLIDESGGKFVVIPHRMNTMPLAQDLPKSMHNVFEADSSFRIDKVDLVIEDLYHTRGSCCEHGKYEVAPCYGWWYQCKEWGIQDMSPWFKFGNYGFTFPPATEHRGKCNYSPHKRICDLPANCNIRTPRRGLNESFIGADSLCGAHVFIDTLGPDSAERKKILKNKSVETMKTSDSKWKHLTNSGGEEVEQLQLAEHELQLLLTEVTRLRRRIRTSRYYLKQLSNNHTSMII